MSAFAKDFGDFVRSSRIAAIGIGLLGYIGVVRLVGTAQDFLVWAVPASVAFWRKNGQPNLPEIPYHMPQWDLLAQSLSTGVLLLALATALALFLFRPPPPGKRLGRPTRNPRLREGF